MFEKNKRKRADNPKVYSPRLEISKLWKSCTISIVDALFPGNEDLIACDRITLYSTKFAAFIKSPLDIGRRRRVYATPFGRALSKCTLFEDPATLAHPRTLMPLAVVYDYQFSLTDVSYSSFGPSANGGLLRWRIADCCALCLRARDLIWPSNRANDEFARSIFLPNFHVTFRCIIFVARVAQLRVEIRKFVATLE